MHAIQRHSDYKIPLGGHSSVPNRPWPRHYSVVTLMESGTKRRNIIKAIGVVLHTRPESIVATRRLNRCDQTSVASDRHKSKCSRHAVRLVRFGPINSFQPDCWLTIDYSRAMKRCLTSQTNSTPPKRIRRLICSKDAWASIPHL